METVKYKDIAIYVFLHVVDGAQASVYQDYSCITQASEMTFLLFSSESPALRQIVRFFLKESVTPNPGLAFRVFIVEKTAVRRRLFSQIDLLHHHFLCKLVRESAVTFS